MCLHRYRKTCLPSKLKERNKLFCPTCCLVLINLNKGRLLTIQEVAIVFRAGKIKRHLGKKGLLDLTLKRTFPEKKEQKGKARLRLLK